MSAADHREQAEAQGAIRVAIITVSDTRTPETDTSGQTIRELLEAAGHAVAGYRIVRDEPVEVEQALEDFCGRRSTVGDLQRRHGHQPPRPHL